MIRSAVACALIAGLLTSVEVAATRPAGTAQASAQVSAADAEPFLGDWTLTLHGQNGPGTFDPSVTLITLTTGDFFGEVALLTGAPRNATVVARGPVEVFTLAKEHFDQALRRSKSLEEQLREVLYRRA